jgi:hypothetical protein
MRTALVSLFLAAGLLACQTRPVELSQAPTTPPSPAPSPNTPEPNNPIPNNPAIPQAPPTPTPGTGGGTAAPIGAGGGEFGTGGASGAGGGAELPGGIPDGGLTLKVHGSVAAAH